MENRDSAVLFFTQQWKRRAKDAGKELEKVESRELSYQMRNQQNRQRKRQLRRELRDERAKEAQWKALAKGYKHQVEDDRASAQVRWVLALPVLREI